jgi:hypothetical protein
VNVEGLFAWNVNVADVDITWSAGPESTETMGVGLNQGSAPIVLNALSEFADVSNQRAHVGFGDVSNQATPSTSGHASKSVSPSRRNCAFLVLSA